MNEAFGLAGVTAFQSLVGEVLLADLDLSDQGVQRLSHLSLLGSGSARCGSRCPSRGAEACKIEGHINGSRKGGLTRANA